MSNKSIKVRATAHRGRTGKHGAYNPKHNDRNFDVSRSDHIDINKADENVYWHCYQSESPDITFEEVEKKFYTDFFSEALERKNQNYIKNRHKERVQTMDEYRTSERYCPEEVIFQLGTREQERPPSKVLWEIVAEYVQWQKGLWYDKRNKVKIIVLDVSLHRDEPFSADHVHLRQVYMVKNKDGFWEVNQEEALKRIGIERGNLDKERGRYNNRKKVFTEIARSKFIEIAKEHGIGIIEEPKDVGQSGLELMQYKAKQELTKLEKLYFEVKKLETDNKHLQVEKKYLEDEVKRLRANPILQQPQMIERDEYFKDFYPHIWEMANDYVNHTKKWEPPVSKKKSKEELILIHL